MATVTNLTHKPIVVPLPGGKTLHLSPHKSGAISDHDIDHAPVRKLIDDEVLEVVGSTQKPRHGGDKRPIPASGPQGRVADLHQFGDR